MDLATWLRKLPPKKALWKLYDGLNRDYVWYTAGGVAYSMLFAIFPALIFFLTLLPYLPIPHLHESIMQFIYESLPSAAAGQIEGVIGEVTIEKRGGLLSFGALATLWVASGGIYSTMQLLNGTYGVVETRAYWKARGMSILLTLAFAVMIISAFALIIFGGFLQEWINSNLGVTAAVMWLFWLFRWVIIFILLLSGFAVIYYYGPDVDQEFRFITPGSVVGVIVLAVASVLFRIYIENFGDYAATYGSLGAVMILMLWLYIFGFVLLAGSEINAIIEDKHPDGKSYGERRLKKEVDS